MLFHRSPKPQFGESVLALLVVFFALMVQIRPIVGLTGLGTTLLVIAVLIELNRVRIWDDYKKAWKKRKGLFWHAPHKIYYNLNVYVVWPLVALLGLACLWAAYNL